MLDTIDRLRSNIAQVFLGEPQAIDRVIRCLLARGHLLIDDVPGVGKTMLATALARSIDCRFSRIQLTPDLLPADVLGVSVFDRRNSEFEFRKGPIFANIVLADEINRASPRTQSALLEAMNEATVSIDGASYTLGQPFMLVATQNPLEFEGTYPLPESQLDRFLMRISLGYPTAENEARVLDIRPATAALPDLPAVMTRDDVLDLQRKVDEVRMDRTLADYIVAVATKTREHEEIRMGLSPRGTLAVAQAARASAVMEGRDYCVPEDILTNILPVCAHRVLSKTHMANGQTSDVDRVITEVLESLEAPA